MTRAMNDIYANMQEMFKDLRINQNEQFAQLNSNMSTLKKQNEDLLLSNLDIKTSMSEIISEQKDFRMRLEALESKDQNATIQAIQMEQQLENMERKIRETSVEIRNIPVENNAQMIEAIGKIHQVLQLDFEYSRDVRSAFRLPTKEGRVRPVVLEFTTVHKQSHFLKAVRAYNLSNQSDKLNTNSINMPGEKKLIYVSEYLTKKAKHLHYLSRELIKKGDWKYCWTNRGKVFLRSNEGQPVIEIKNSEQLLDLSASMKD